MILVALCAGYATRMYPLTENFPKPLLEVGGRTILDRLLDDPVGADRKVVISNHKFAHIFQDWAAGKDVEIIDDGTTANENRIGAVEDLRLAIRSLQLDDDLLVVAGDNLLDFSLRAFVDYARSKDAPCAMRYYEADEARLKKCGVCGMGENDLVEKMVEKPAVPFSHWCMPPFYFYPRRALPLIMDAQCGADAPGSLAAWFAENDTLYAMEMPGKRYDVGSLAGYEALKDSWKD